MKIIGLSLLAAFFSTIAICQTTIKGKITDKDGTPLAGVIITNITQKTNSNTSKGGTYSLSVFDKDTVVVSFIGFKPNQFIVNKSIEEYDIILEEDDSRLNDVVVSYAGSSKSSWTGATLFYNLDGSDLDNVVGSAKVKLNTAKQFKGKFRLNIIGNISKFSGATDPENVKGDILEISQSAQGLSAGFEPIYSIIEDKTRNQYFNVYANLMYKMNLFQKVNNTDKNIALSQGRFSLGMEFEGIEFVDGGKLLHLGVEATRSIFSKEKYNGIFNTEKSSLNSLELSLVVPLFSNLGLLVNQTATKGIKPVFGAGFIIQN